MIRKRITLQLQNGTSLDSLASPRLFRTLTYAVGELYGKDEAESIIEENIAVTDLLYWSYGKNKQKIYFYPKPVYVPINTKGKQLVYPRLKAFKKAAYVSEKAFKNYLANIIGFLQGENNVKIEKNLIFSEKEEIHIKIKKEEIPHNLVGRIKTVVSNEGVSTTSLTQEFFYIPEIWIANGGIYFDIVSDNENSINKLIAGMRFLEDKGLGKKITSGKGNFEIKQVEKLDLQPNSESKTKMLLSYWLPSISEMETQKIIPTYYSLIQYQPVNPKIKTAMPVYSVPMPSLYLVSSGSIVTSKANTEIPEIIGKNCQVGDNNNPSVIPGKAVTIPIDINTPKED